ncbi:MAG: radical SAM protein [Clostridiales bacterium]|nr:radical SAM protein [Clostridiales bacterium]
MAENDRSFTTYLNARARRDRLPISGTFELSPVCNLACKMCYVRKTPAEVKAHSRPILTLEQWKRMGDEALDEGLLFLLLTGGEPFLWPDFRELYGYLHRKGALISVNSNGTLITEDTVAWLTDHPPARINITLYGASDEAYRRLCGVDHVYRRVTEHIDRLLDAGIQVKLNASMTPYNVSDMEGIVRFAQERDLLLEVGTYMFPPIRRDANSVGTGDRFTPEQAAHYSLEHRRLTMPPEQYRQYLEQAANGIVPAPGLDESCIDPVDGTVKCAAGRGSFWVTWDGYMLPCGMVPEPRADAAELGFSRAWQETVRQTEQIRLSGVCRSCPNKNVCHSCMAMAIAETGSHAGIPAYLCRMAEAVRDEAAKALTADANHQTDINGKARQG